ncbi:MAG TPA: ATP-binding protein [Bryobacteraceae bacterium]|jgi:nitrogen fixation/metabolism regulation signal transduction histidine kinase|nr:ATP-binding protein [Bryobacteraceae bacterium]
MNRLENKLILMFIAATVAPLLITLWISVQLLDRSLSLSPNRELDETSKALKATGRELYRRACDSLRRDVETGRAVAARYPAEGAPAWPQAWREFWESGDANRFVLADAAGGKIDYLVRHEQEAWVYSTSLDSVKLGALSGLYARARAILNSGERRNLRRGFSYTLLSLAASIWFLSFVFLIYWAHRISRPIRDLTAGLAAVANGDLTHRVQPRGDDEVGAAIRAFNHMALQVEQSRERLISVTRLESWQALARKTAHEVKNSLTPIRLTMEEVAVRSHEHDSDFLQQAAQIVVDEVTSLERRVRAFSELGSEPPVCPRALNVNALLEERIALLKVAHPEVIYNVRLAGDCPPAFADEDLIKGVLTNLLQNAAEAVSPGGVILGITAAAGDRVGIEVHDSGPGLSASARRSLFEPSISFKSGGMGLGLSIARKSALLLGGDILLVPGELGGAAFRVLLPAAI